VVSIIIIYHSEGSTNKYRAKKVRKENIVDELTTWSCTKFEKV
jgi:hypothetical protein